MANVILGSDAPATSPQVTFPHGLSVFFPAYNDAPSLPGLLATTFDTLDQHVADYEVIVVNDGSADDTASVLQALEREYHPRLRVITHPQNRGYGAALRTGLAAACKPYIFYTDGDGQYDPAELPRLLEAMTSGVGLVNGYKRERHDPWHRIFIGNVYNRFARWLFGIRLRDIDCDYRLIRRSALDLDRLQSTGGTICIEIVRSLELSGADVVEVPVHHYPRMHGRSQFFRVPALANTLVQLLGLFGRQVLLPSLKGQQPFSLAAGLLLLIAVTVLSLLTYGRSLGLPFIADDYIQIGLARDYGHFRNWGALLGDALYRCRATSLVLTYWTEQAFGLNPLAYRLSSMVIHILNAMLVFGLGVWRPVGWKVSTVAALFFAASQRHAEAVIWYAALPELLVFTFAMASFLCWVRYQQDRTQQGSGKGVYAASLALFVLALFSKESAVVVAPLCAVAALLARRGLLSTAPYFIASAVYFGLTYMARDNHLHFNDGTFSLHAPFWTVLTRSMGGLLWIWGFAALAALVAWKKFRTWQTLITLAAVWMVVTLLPYSFLTYMPRVPSRHTYFASVGLALLIGAALSTLREWEWMRKRSWAWVTAAALLIAQESAYVAFYKHDQYAERAEPTEALIRNVRNTGEAAYVRCFPYTHYIGEFALRIVVPTAEYRYGPEVERRPDAVNYCTGSNE
jgi:hypothetical protein